jgi:predicted ATP-dependent serine protease
MKKIYCCRDCGDKISYPTAIYGKGRCNSCAKQGSLNPRIGKTFSDASKEKISKALKGKFSGRKSHLYM